MARPLRCAGLILAMFVAGSLPGQTAVFQSAPTKTAQQAASAQTLDSYIEHFQFTELRKAIETLPVSPERDYYSGILANRQGKTAESVSLLEKSLPWAKQSGARYAAAALETIADNYAKLFRYDDAARAYEDLFQHYAESLGEAQKKDDEDDLTVLKLLRTAPPQNIKLDGPVDLTTKRNPTLDTIDTDLTVNGVTGPWIVDTGANFSTVSESFARRLGVKLLPGQATTQGITGAENPLRVAILPELHLGGAIVRNVALLVLSDSSLNVPSGPKERYQINAVLGYPVLQALGRFTLTRDGHFLAGANSPSSDSGAPLYMYKLTPLLECMVDNRPLVFAYDSGADHTAFSDRYFREFPDQFRGLEKHFYGMGGAGGLRKLDVFYLPEVKLGVGAVTATLHHVPVLPDLGTNLSRYYGNLGRDLTDPYDHFTVDFTNMRLSLGKLSEQKPK